MKEEISEITGLLFIALACNTWSPKQGVCRILEAQPISQIWSSRSPCLQLSPHSRVFIFQIQWNSKKMTILCTRTPHPCYLMRSFSRGLCSTIRQGLSERVGWAPGTGGDFDGELLPRIFLFTFGVASLLCTLWGKRSCRIRSRNSSTICWKKSRWACSLLLYQPTTVWRSGTEEPEAILTICCSLSVEDIIQANSVPKTLSSTFLFLPTITSRSLLKAVLRLRPVFSQRVRKI